MKLKVVSANLLNDRRAPQQHSHQADRVSIIAEQVVKLANGTPDVLYVCEASSTDNVQELARLLGLSVVGVPINYSSYKTHTEFSAFLVSAQLVEDAVTNFVAVEGVRSHKLGFQRLDFHGWTVVGAHYPELVLVNARARRAFSSVALEQKGDGPFIVAGDFNNLRPSRSRRVFAKHNLTEVTYPEGRPKCPKRKLLGVEFTKLLPFVSLDAIYSSQHLEVLESSQQAGDGSDHPFVYAELKATKAFS